MSNHLKNQGGYAILVLMALMLIIMAMGTVSFRYVEGDIKHSKRSFHKIKADYVAEAALNWGLALSQRIPEYSCATHDSTGVTADPTMLGNRDMCDTANFSWTGLPTLYESGSNITIDGDGWVTSTPSHKSYSLTGENQEIVAFKVWFDTDTTIRITGKGTVRGVSTELNLFGTVF